MSNLLTRSISGFVYVSLFLSAILFGEKSYILLITAFSLVCLWEFTKMIKFKSFIPYILLPLAIYYFSAHITENQILIISLITFLCFVQLMRHLYATTKKYPTSFFGKLDVTIRYIIFPFCFLTLIPFASGTYQYEILICILIFIWVNDSFAFIVGSTIGKNKLFEQVSPKKTTEGFFGGWIFSLIAAYFIFKLHKGTNIQLMDWFLIASLISIFGTIGDLVESKFKRQARIKDSGTIMPGHGGLLDRLDSLYFVAPFIYLYLHYII
ncbi:MAG: phosphatidate cytidylyltransferase [Flavobacteriaceae bacterium]|nr:phosphatidate cytidylyltransferase [Flavobacteriaceae bacterium]